MSAAERTSKVQSTILEEEFDESYEPTDEEIMEYAQFLGLNMDREPHLVWIAREGLKAPLPKEWKPCQTEDGQLYYFNFSNGESIWDHPCDEQFKILYEEERRKCPLPPPGWQASKIPHKYQLPMRSRVASTTAPQPTTITNIKIEDMSQSPTPVLKSPMLRLESAVGDIKQPRRPEGDIGLKPLSRRPSLAGSIMSMSFSPPAHVEDFTPRPDGRRTPLSTRNHADFTLSDSSAAGIPESSSARLTSITMARQLVPESDAGQPSHDGPVSVTAPVVAQLTVTGEQYPSLSDRQFAAFNDAKQRELATKLMHDELEDMKKQLEERVRIEREQHDLHLEDVQHKFVAEREEALVMEQKKLELWLLQKKNELDDEYGHKLRNEEQKTQQQFEVALRQVETSYEDRRIKEEKRLAKELEDKLRLFRSEMEGKYFSLADEAEYRERADRKRRDYEEQQDRELDALRQEFHGRKTEMIREFEQFEENERRKLESNCADLRQSWKARQEQEERTFEAQLAGVRDSWKERITAAENETVAREKLVRAQAMEQHQRSLREKEAGLQRELDTLTAEWQTKIVRLKAQLSQEQTELENKLAQVRSHSNRESEHLIVTSFVNRRNDANSLVKDNDAIFLQQKKRREYLSQESAQLDKLEQNLKQTRGRLEQEQTDLQSLEQTLAKKNTNGKQRGRKSPRYTSSERDCSRQHEFTESPVWSRSTKQHNAAVDANPDWSMSHPAAALDILDSHDAHLMLDKEMELEDDFDDLSDSHNVELERSGRLPDELQAVLEKEARLLLKSKQSTEKRRQMYQKRRQQLEETRERWRREVNDIAERTDAAEGDEPMTNDLEQPDPNTYPDTDLDPIIEQIGHQMPVMKHDRLVRTIQSRLSVPVQSQHRASRTPPTWYSGRPSDISRAGSGLTTAYKWNLEQQKTQDTLRNHVLWLHRFRQRVGLERSPGGYLHRNTSVTSTI